MPTELLSPTEVNLRDGLYQVSLGRRADSNIGPIPLTPGPKVLNYQIVVQSMFPDRRHRSSHQRFVAEERLQLTIVGVMWHCGFRFNCNWRRDKGWTGDAGRVRAAGNRV